MGSFFRPVWAWGLTCLLLGAILSPALGVSDTTSSTLKVSRESSRATNVLPGGTIVRVVSSARIRPSRLQRGDVLNGVLPRPLYWREREALPAGAKVRMIVDRIERLKSGEAGGHHWLLYPFTWLRQRCDHRVVIRSAEINLPDGETVPIRVTVLEVRDRVRV